MLTKHGMGRLQMETTRAVLGDAGRSSYQDGCGQTCVELAYSLSSLTPDALINRNFYSNFEELRMTHDPFLPQDHVDPAGNDTLNSTLLKNVRSMFAIRPSVPWLVAAVALICTALYCTTVRVPNSMVDIAGLQLIVAGMLLAAVTCSLVAFSVLSKRSYALAWCSTAAAFVCCVVLT